jgi:hypothetical protein
MKEDECGKTENKGERIDEEDGIFPFEGEYKGERVWIVLYHQVHKKCLIKTFKKSNMIPNSNGGHLIMMRSSGIRMNTNREFRQKNNNIVPNKSDAFFV